MEETGFDTLVKKNADVEDTLALIIRTVNDYSKSFFIRECVKRLCPAGTSREQCIRNVFDYYCRNVEYVLDSPGVEKVYTPQRTIREGAGDCKKAATFLASVLKATGIEPVLKHVYYSGNDFYTHIYVVVPNPSVDNYITLDPTNNCAFNSEVNYSTGALYFLNGKVMDLRQMGKSTGARPGVNFTAGCDTLLDDMNSIGSRLVGAGVLSHSEAINKLTGGNAKLKSIFAPVPIHVQRAAFMNAVRNNLKGLAGAMAVALGKNPAVLNIWWQQFGGDVNELKKAVIDGAKKSPTNSTIRGVFDDIGEFFTDTALPMIHSAAPLLTAVPGVGPILAPVVSYTTGLLTAHSKPSSPLPTLPQLTNLITQTPPDVRGRAMYIPLSRPDFTVEDYITLQNEKDGPKLTPAELNTAANNYILLQKSNWDKEVRAHPEYYSDVDRSQLNTQASSFFSAGGFIFKSCLLISILHISPTLRDMLATICFSGPLIYYSLKKIF